MAKRSENQSLFNLETPAKPQGRPSGFLVPGSWFLVQGSEFLVEDERWQG